MALSRRRMIERTQEAGPTDDELRAQATTLMSIEVNSEETQGRLTRLYQIAKRPISLLSTEQCSDLDIVRKLARRTYGTSAYNELHSQVMTLFAEAGSYLPHTVGSFFIGCVTPTNIDSAVPDVNRGCSLLCGDALPPPTIPGAPSSWGFCSQNVIWCLLSSSSMAKNILASQQSENRPLPRTGIVDHTTSTDPESYDFIRLTILGTSSKAILFLDVPTYDAFNGFTRHEKARLLYRLNISDVKLLSYDKNGTNYTDLLGKTIRVQDIKQRPDVRDAEPRPMVAIRQPVKLQPEQGDVPLSWSQAIPLAVAMVLFILLGVSTILLFNRMSKQKPRRYG